MVAGLLANAVVLGHHAALKVRIPRVRRVVGRLVAEDVQVQLQIDGVPGNAQILKARAQKCDRRHVAHQRVLGRNLRHDAIRRNHIQNIESFDNGGDQRAPPMAILDLTVPSHLCVRRAIYPPCSDSFTKA